MKRRRLRRWNGRRRADLLDLGDEALALFKIGCLFQALPQVAHLFLSSLPSFEISFGLPGHISLFLQHFTDLSPCPMVLLERGLPVLSWQRQMLCQA